MIDLFNALKTVALQRTAPPPLWLILLTFPPTLALIRSQRIWRWARHAITLTHETGHAVVALCCGRRVSGIRFATDTSGVTVSSGRERGPGMIFTLWGGYAAPPGLALGLAALIAHRWAGLALVALTVTAVIVFVLVRSWWGLVLVPCVITLLGACSLLLGPQLQQTFLIFTIFFLLCGGARTLVELQIQHRRGETVGSDIDQLQRITWIPALVWLYLFFLWLGLCVFATIWLLWR